MVGLGRLAAGLVAWRLPLISTAHPHLRQYRCPNPGPPNGRAVARNTAPCGNGPLGPQTRFVRQTMTTRSARSALAAATGKASGDLNGVAAAEPVMHKLPKPSAATTASANRILP